MSNPILHHDFIFSLKPKYAEKILDGVKTVELRRRFTKRAVAGGRAYLYASSPDKQMLGYAEIVNIACMPVSAIWATYGSQAGASRDEFVEYFAGVAEGHVISLERACRFKKALSLEFLREQFGFRPPVSYQSAGDEYRSL